MCGLVGAFRTKQGYWEPQDKIKKYLYMGLHLSSFRGTQGTGVGLVADDGEVVVEKSHLSSVDWLRTEGWDWVESNLTNSHVIMGHTRFPTFSNTVHARNAQPFCYDNTDKTRTVMLTHNGHINSHTDLTKGIKDFSHPVDSAHVARAMAEAANPKDLLPEMRGNYAMVWYDEERRLMMAANNGGRELWMAPSKDKQKMYYCSERTMLKFILDRAGMEYAQITEVPEFQVLYWDLDAKELHPSKFFKYKEKPFVLPPSKPYTHGNWEGGGGTASKKGSTVWARLTESSVLIPYPDLTNGQKSEYGKIWCTIPASSGSICEVTGVKSITWNEVILRYFKNPNTNGYLPTFPCRVQQYEMEDDAEGKKYPLYTVTLDMDALTHEMMRLKDREKVGESGKHVIPAAISGNGVIPFSPTFVPGPGKSLKISKEAWDKVAKEGCFYCDGAIFPFDAGKVGWQLINTDVSGEDLYQCICPMCVARITRGELTETRDKAI